MTDTIVPEPQLRYSVVIEWDNEDRIFIATVPELPGCRTHGDTYEEAIAQVQDAMLTLLDGFDPGDPRVPKPRFFDIEHEPWPDRDWVSAANARQPLVTDDDGVSAPS